MDAYQPTLRVLVVENEVLLSLAAEQMLRELGHEVVGTARTAEGAVLEAECKRPDVVLMDVGLDGAGDGIDAAQEIQDHLGIASIFATAEADAETRERALSVHPAGFLLKPLFRDDLGGALKEFVHRSNTEIDPVQSQSGDAATPFN